MKVISITGGKGGIGKTTITVNLAVAFAKAGKRVLIFDADLGLANVDVLLGLKPKKTIEHVMSGECTLNDIVITGPHGIKIIPAASGIQSVADLSMQQASDLIHSFSTLAEKMDIMLIDLASGISRQVIDFTHAAENILVVICNDPASLMDSYAVIKLLHTKYGRNNFGVIVNKVRNLREGYQVYLGFQETIAKFMNLSVEYVGYIPNDDYVGMAARENVTVYDRFPISQASQAFRDLQSGIQIWASQAPASGGIQYFFERLIMPEDKGELCKV
jgi:flagellar biosynthesis protein FlhG